jgi:type VI secretion system protein ImpK
LIDKVADALKQVEGKIVVVGYTDNVPIRTLRFESNYALSKERAATVARVLGAQLGSAERINFEGNGEESPVSTNDTAEGRARNRRVEIVLKSVDAVR